MTRYWPTTKTSERINKLNLEKKQRIKALKKIRSDVNMISYGHTSLVRERIIFGTIIGFISGIFTNTNYLHLTDLSGLFVAATSIAGSIIGYKLFAKYKSRTERIYDRLSMYQPIDEQAYRNLQMKAKENFLAPDDILTWIEIEKNLIEPQSQSKNELARQRFASHFKK